MSSIMSGPENYAAKRAHKKPCDLCGEPIVIGDPCIRWTYMDDYAPSRVRVHAACEKEAKKYEWYGDEDGWPDTYPLREERRGAYR